MKKYKKTEQMCGVTPEELKKADSFIIHKSAKKGRVSFLITKALLDNILETSAKIQKKSKLIISIPVGTEEYILTCAVTKVKT
jgi:hypothetical protein